MNSILAVEKGLPPGLLLPTADESTEKYRSEIFNHSDHPYEDIIDYGTFVVALVMLDSQSNQRVSFMPNQNDIDRIFSADYGISRNRLLREYGGIAKLQRALGWYPKGYRPPQEELVRRLKWMATYALDPEADLEKQTAEEILRWGAQRDLLPSSVVSYEIIGRNNNVVQKIFGIEKPNSTRQYTFFDIYRFGAKVLKDKKTPPNEKDLVRDYGEYFHAEPDQVIRAFFGTATKFWLEFDYLARKPQLDKELLLNLGVRYAIEHDGQVPNKPQIEALSTARKFPSTLAARHFGGLINYQEAILKGHEEYLNLHAKLCEEGVSDEVVRLACRKYETGNIFRDWLIEHADIMAKISGVDPKSKYIRRLMVTGPNLEDEGIHTMQLEDLKKALHTLRITKDSIRFVLELIPRVHSDEALGIMIVETMNTGKRAS